MHSLFSQLPQPKRSNNSDNLSNNQNSSHNTVNKINTIAKVDNHFNSLQPNSKLSIFQSSNPLIHTQDITQKVALQGHRSGNVVYASYEDLVEKHVDSNELVRPSKEDELIVAENTKDAIDARVHQKIKTAHKLDLKEQRQREDQIDFVKYTPLDPATGKNGQTKIIRIVEEERDPLEPSRFKNKKLPARPPSPPVPIMRSSDKKLTNEDMEQWNIPPCVSNWKNKNGFVVPLDKRMAADGRNQRNIQINDRFASLAKTVYDTEKRVREEIEKKKEYQRIVETREREKEEEETRKLAMELRNSLIKPEELEGFKEREELRKKIREETIEELRKETLKRKKAFYSQIDDRDISDEISLEQHVVSRSGNTQSTQNHQHSIDARLEQLASNDMGSGFGDDDEYNVYDKPLSNRSSESVLYRPRQTLDQYYDNEDSSNIKSKFSRVALGTHSGPRDKNAPIEFKSENEGNEPQNKTTRIRHEEDEFEIFTRSGEDSNKRKRTLDHIGNSGFMTAAAGGAPLDLDHYRESKRQRINFSKSSNQ